MSDADDPQSRTGEAGGDDAAICEGVSRRGVLTGLGTAGLLGAAGTASADSRGQLGRSGDPVAVAYAEELNGGVTEDAGGNPQVVTDLLGTDLAVDGSCRLTATDARLDVTDGTTTVTNVEGITFGTGLSVTDDGDGTVRVDR